jgi:tRNA G10  N-methylase Trm11
MKYIHPFPARMAPEIILNKLKTLKEGQKVLDPMVGSGMVLTTASRLNIQSYGIDIDPLSVMISKVSATKLDENKAKEVLNNLIELSCKTKEVYLPWIDEDTETSDFINYWFDEKQLKQLRLLAFNLVQAPLIDDQAILDVLKLSISRLIITKEPKASLARDTAHSRPHKTIITNDFDILKALPKSLKSILQALGSSEIKCNTLVSIGDSRRLTGFSDHYFDMIITSPPYLNAIDYMRGHKLSLVWLGYKISELRNIRAVSIGSERKVDINKKRNKNDLLKIVDDLHLNSQMIERYFLDLYDMLAESYRVLKIGGMASYVVGNSNQKKNLICNNQLLQQAAKYVGFNFISEVKREIPNSRRYMPINGTSSLSKRIKTEFIITLKKSK